MIRKSCHWQKKMQLDVVDYMQLKEFFSETSTQVQSELWIIWQKRLKGLTSVKQSLVFIKKMVLWLGDGGTHL